MTVYVGRHFGRAPAALLTLLLFLTLPLFVHSYHQHSHGHGHLHHAPLHQRAADQVPKFPIVNSTLGRLTTADAQAMILKAHAVMSVFNKERLANPNFNKNVMDKHPGQHVDDVQPLPYQEGVNFTTLRRRQLSNATSKYLSYSIPPELAEAARIIAESTPQTPHGDHEQRATEFRIKNRKQVKDTNMPPQKLVAADGLHGFVPHDLPLTTNNDTRSLLQPRQSTTQSYWMADIAKRGASPYAPAGYTVWRNVLDYGAKGDGKTDDTAAINKAISDGGRCGANCGSSTIYPAVVYFPPGTYLVSSPIIQYYNTQFLGNPFTVPTILAASSFVGLGVISSDVYMGGQDEWYVNTNNFLRSIKNFKIDIRNTPQNASVCAIHWQVAQAASLENVSFYMLYYFQYPNSTQQGIFMENGSGGFLADLTFVGGKFGAYFGNQQFTTHDLVFLFAETACQIHWDWAWTMQDITISSCGQGVKIVGGAATGPGSTGQAVGSFILVDAEIVNTAKGIVTTLYQENSTSLLLQNVAFKNVDVAVSEEAQGRVLLAGNKTGTIGKDNWGFGRVTNGSTATSTFANGADIPVMNRTAVLLADGNGHYKPNFFTRRRPKYDSIGLSQIMDVKTYGAKGDGVTDDTAALNSLLAAAANMSSIVYFPFGVYVIKDTLKVPVGSRIIGQAWSQIMATGSKFADATKPKVAVQVGCVGEVGVVEIQDLMFTVSGPTAGAVLVEWNVYQSSKGAAGMWDTHFRVGGAIGSNLQKANCPKNSGTVNPNCMAASLLLNLTPGSSAYLENIWAWTADHDMDVQSQDQIDIYSARGILIQSKLAWLYGTSSEHNVLYQYQLSSAQNILLGMIQTETPYFQPVPKGPAPFPVGLFPDDPDFVDCKKYLGVGCYSAWALRIISSNTIYSLGSGLYSFFSAYSQDCLNTESCQIRGVYIEESYDVWIYNLCTKAITEMVSPLKGFITYGKDNKNGFLSSILAWLQGAKQTAGGRVFPGFQIWTADQLNQVVYSNLTSSCVSALTQVVKCDPWVRKFQDVAWRGKLVNKTLTDSVCDASCGTNLKSYFDSVTLSCAGQGFAGSVPNLLAGRLWSGYNETCVKDTTTQNYCNDVIANFTTVATKEQMPQTEACSFCNLEKFRIMRNSNFSAYNSDWAQDYAYFVNLCGKTDNTTVLPPYPPKPVASVARCLTGKTSPLALPWSYISAAGDTCTSIALKFNMSSAAIYFGNQQLINDCNNITQSTALCLPMACASVYQYNNNDTCYKIERRPEYMSRIGLVRRFNPWVNFECSNLNTTKSVYGNVLCMGPYVGGPNSTVANGTDNTIPVRRPGYQFSAISPPANATVAVNTTLKCGEWHVANTTATSTIQGDSCTGICLQHDIPYDLFLTVNPSLSATNCTGSLKNKYAYCAGPMYIWNTTLF